MGTQVGRAGLGQWAFEELLTLLLPFRWAGVAFMVSDSPQAGPTSGCLWLLVPLVLLP